MKNLKSHKTFDGLTQFWEHDSTCTKTKMKFSTFIPDGEVKGAIIWLSGLTCNEENFITKAGAQKSLSKHQMMVICPDTSPRGLDLAGEHDAYDFGSGAGFYVNATTPGYKDHYRMYDYINEEIYGILKNDFKAKKIAISGHSMGGHGALTIGLKHAFKYASISAFSPIVNPIKCPWGKKAFTGYFGDDQELWQTHDATALILDAHRHPAEILIDQGRADEFLETQLLTENFRSACQKLEQSCKINYRDGYDHSYYFISTFIDSHIEHHANFTT
jgi:S-formylglutathione hydrolase